MQMQFTLQMLREQLHTAEEPITRETQTDTLPTALDAQPVYQAVAVAMPASPENRGDSVNEITHEPKKKKSKTTKEQNVEKKRQTNKDPNLVPKPKRGWILFNHTVRTHPAYALEKQELDKCEFAKTGPFLKSVYDALSSDDRDAYKRGEVPTIKAPALAGAPAPAAASASRNAREKEAMEMDNPTDSDDDEMTEFDDYITKLEHKIKNFNQHWLNAYSKWIINQLVDEPWIRGDCSKHEVFNRMCTDNIGIDDENKFNEHIAAYFERYLSKPCFLRDVLWDEEVVSAFAKWQMKVPSATLDIFCPGSDLHNCTVHDFKQVQEQMNQFLKSSSSIDSQTFATELLIFCAKKEGTEEFSRDHWLHHVDGQLVLPEQA